MPREPTFRAHACSEEEEVEERRWQVVAGPGPRPGMATGRRAGRQSSSGPKAAEMPGRRAWQERKWWWVVLGRGRQEATLRSVYVQSK